jgi:hypothetical protein
VETHEPLRVSPDAGGPCRRQAEGMRTGFDAAVDLYWIPLGAGGHCVRLNGRLYEAIAAARERRPRCALYHAALIVERSGERHAIELAPSWDADTASRGVVRTGAVGSRRLGRWRLFRYELRCWRGGSIPDLRYAVGGPHRLSSAHVAAERILELTTTVPTPVWGRDELKCGEMWNSNSVVAWLLATAGIPTDAIEPPAGGRAPGWNAGLVGARRAGAGPKGPRSGRPTRASTFTPTGPESVLRATGVYGLPRMPWRAKRANVYAKGGVP